MDSKIARIQEIFHSMSYGENIENTDQANEWLKSVEIVDKSSELDNILKTVKTDAYKPNKRHLTKLAQEIENSAGILSQIEILSRGILSKDTKAAVPVLAQYFSYYANFITKNEKEHPNWKPEGCVVAVFGDDHPLWLLGLVLGPALSAGYTVLVQTGTKFAAVVTYLLDIAKKVGISEDALILVPSNEGELQPYLSYESVLIVTLFVDLLNPKYRGINKFHKKVLAFSSYKTPMVVFENSDIDSAVESVIDAAWGYQGMSPWSINTIIIQENIFSKFTDKLKNKLLSVKVGNGNDKLADISYPNSPDIYSKLTKTVEKAKSLGIEVFQKDQGGNNFSPTLIIGSKVDTNNVLKAPENDSTVTLVAFRSIDEAVSIANNSRQGLGASVWSENIGLANEVARKLKVNNVWINSHGLASPEVSLTPLKDSGVGFFGGKEGFLEYIEVKKNGSSPNSLAMATKLNKNDAVRNAINSGKNAGALWSKNSYLNRTKILCQVGEFVEKNKKTFINEKLSEIDLENFISHLTDCIFEAREFGAFTIPSYIVTSLKVPKGVLVIEMRQNMDHHNLKLFLGALLEGNAVVILNDLAKHQNFLEEISKKLPSGLVSVLPYSLESVKTASLHKEMNGYFSNDSNIIFGSLPLADSKIFSIVSDSWAEAFRKTIVIKNIWSNVGQSSQCSL